MILDERSFTLVIGDKLPESLVAELLVVWQQRLEARIAELEAELQDLGGPSVRIERDD